MEEGQLSSSFSTSPLVVDGPPTDDISTVSCLNSGGFIAYQPPPNYSINIVDFGDKSGIEIEIEMEMHRRSSMARKRRQKISEKIRCLQKILPWDKKMNIAAMLEEAYKYVQFLQAQLLALQSMPNCICTNTNNSHSSSSSYSSSSSSPLSSPALVSVPGHGPVPTSEMFMLGGGGRLENLNRQQVLEVVVNSKVAQTVLYSRGWCLYSVEQLILLMNQIGETETDNLLFHPSSSIHPSIHPSIA